MKGNKSIQKAKSLSVNQSGYGSGSKVKGPDAKPFSGRDGGGSRGSQGGKYDEASVGFSHSYGESSAKSIVNRLHKHTRG